MSDSVKVYLGYHKPYNLLTGETIVPLHVGRDVAMEESKDGQLNQANVDWLYDHMAGDNTGDNISCKNRQYAELTGIYWLWKHYEEIGNPDHIGWMQYRRHFIFREDAAAPATSPHIYERTYSIKSIGYIYDGYQEDFGITDENIRRYCQDYDVIIPQPVHLHHLGVKNLYENYAENVNGFHPKDLKLYLQALKKCAPEYYDLARESINTHTTQHWYLSFILKKEIFFDFCQKLFAVIGYVEARLDTKNYNANGKRTLGFLAELFFDVYFSTLLSEKQYRCKELYMTMVYARAPIASPADIKNQTALILLAHSDYESLEITLANYGERLKNTTAKMFILQNGRDTYDAERTLRVARRYEKLYPRHFQVIDSIRPQKPYFAIRELIDSDLLADYHYICKVDDDVFPLTDDWLDKLCQLFYEQVAKNGERLGFVTGLINNNPYGFQKLIASDRTLADKYFHNYAREHVCGVTTHIGESDIVSPNQIKAGMKGTIWGYPYLARFIHEELSLQPDRFRQLVAHYPNDFLPSEERYSIGCILFDKASWHLIRMPRLRKIYHWTKDDDDEYLWHYYAQKNQLLLPISLSTPFVHIHFFTQREENRDLIPRFREVYTRWLGINYPIAINTDKDLENENRLRYLEHKLHPYLPERIKNAWNDWTGLFSRLFSIARAKLMLRTRLRRRGWI